jgi:HAD superfamily hydrolase (TIGR01484 family)
MPASVIGSVEPIGTSSSLAAAKTAMRNSEGQAVPATIRLLATDLDGTLIGSANELPLYLTFYDRLQTLRHNGGVKWAACTGRSFRSFWEFFVPMRKLGVIPDYVIIRHAFIFRLTRFGYMPHVAWNITTLIRIWKETRATSDAIQAWHTTVVGGAIGVRTIAKSSGRLAVRFDSEEAAQVAEDMLRLRQAEHRHMHVMRSKTDVEVRMVPATKGIAVAELAKRLNMVPEHILTIGNGHNDLSMLDGSVSGMVGCPANSVYDVMTMVHSRKGHVAENPSLSGVIEILDAFTSGNVSSAIPAEPPPAEHRIKNVGKRAHKHHSKGIRTPHILVFIGMIYATLLAFSTFDILPFSDLIRKPMELLISSVVKLVSLF